jgi:hypothetical protein
MVPMTGSSWPSNSGEPLMTSDGIGMGRLCVPVALLNYLARRADKPERVLATLLNLNSPGRSHCIPSSGDVHQNLRPCVLEAMTVISFRGQDVEASIIGKEWTVHASADHTDLTLARLPHAVRALAGHGPLCEKFDFAFLPRELDIETIMDRGPGVRIRCQPITTNVGLALESAKQGLDDVCGAVSGSDGVS